MMFQLGKELQLPYKYAKTILAKKILKAAEI